MIAVLPAQSSAATNPLVPIGWRSGVSGARKRRRKRPSSDESPSQASIGRPDAVDRSQNLGLNPSCGAWNETIRNGSRTSAPSAEIRVDVQPSAPEPPIATIATVAGRTVRVQWQAPPHGWPATGYILEAGSAQGLTDIGVVPVGGLDFQATVPPGRYYVRIRALNASGASVPGDEVVLDVP